MFQRRPSCSWSSPSTPPRFRFRLLPIFLRIPGTLNYNPGPTDPANLPQLSEWVDCFRKTIPQYRYRASIDPTIR